MPDITLSINAQISSELNPLAKFLSSKDIQSYLVGGYIRDALLGRDTQDIDIAVLGDAVAVAKETATHLNSKFVLLDDINKVARVITPRLHLDFCTIEGDIETDLRRRDFTANAMAVDLNHITSKPAIIDPCSGYDDIQQKTIRATGEDVFKRDPVRLMRAVRHYAELGFDIEVKTKSLIKRDGHLAAGAAAERICEELCLSLATDRAYHALKIMDELNLVSALLPELEACRGVQQPKEHNWDVLDHSIETVAAIDRLFADIRTGSSGLLEIPWTDELESHFGEEIAGGHLRSTVLKIAALLHDIGKPGTKSIEQNGRIRFLNHSKDGAAMAGDAMTRLRFSGREIRAVQRIIEQHMRPTQLSNNWEIPTNRAIYRYFRDTEDEAFDIMLLSLADHLAARGPLLDEAEWQRHIDLIAYVIKKHSEEHSIVAPPKLIDGNDLIALGYEPGPQMGAVLEAVRDGQAAGEINTRDDAVDLARRLFNQ